MSILIKILQLVFWIFFYQFLMASMSAFEFLNIKLSPQSWQRLDAWIESLPDIAKEVEEIKREFN